MLGIKIWKSFDKNYYGKKREKLAYHKLILRKKCVKYSQWNHTNLGFMTVTVK